MSLQNPSQFLLCVILDKKPQVSGVGPNGHLVLILGADLKTVHEPKLECLEEFQYSPSPTRSKDSRDNPEPDSLYMDTDTNDSATETIDKCDMEDTDSVPERNSTSMSEKCVGTSPESS